MSKKPYLICPVSKEIANQVREAITVLRSDPGSKSTADQAIAAVVSITEGSLDFYFVKPLDKMKVNVLGRGIVKMGVNAGIGVLKTFGPRLVKSLSPDQMVVLADVLAEVLVELD